MTPEEMAPLMTGTLRPRDSDDPLAGEGTLLPSPVVQNHAAYLDFLPDGRLICAWFGGTLEGADDISIHAATLAPGADQWSGAYRLSDDPERSEQNPVIFTDTAGDIHLFNTAQPAGNQDECLLRMRPLSPEDGLSSGPARALDLPLGTFIRGRIVLRDDGAWMLPVFRCHSRPGMRWTGSHDTAAVAVSTDGGDSWEVTAVPDSTGCVHMTIVPLAGARMVAFYRRRQADRVHRSVSEDGGRTWSAPVPLTIPNNNSSINALRLADGRVALICNPVSSEDSADRRQSLYDELGVVDDRPDAAGDAVEGCTPVWGVPRAPLTLFLSDDGGETFPHSRVIEDGPGTCLSNNSLDGANKELSYPYLAQGPDGALHIAYTAHRRAIAHVRLPVEALAAIAGEA